jgi:hypothetical protein
VAAVDEDRREPVAHGTVVRELGEASVGAEEGLLDDVLGVVADEAARERVQPAELALGEPPEPLDRGGAAARGDGVAHNSAPS